MFYVIIITVVAVIDQFTKYLVLKYIGMGNELEVIPDFLYLHCISNDGVAFGLLSNNIMVIGMISVMLVFVILIFFLKFGSNFSNITRVTLALFVGGGIGNVIDRVRLGYVVDFIDFRAIWVYIFNFADICVVAGCILLVMSAVITGTDEPGKGRTDNGK